MRHGKINDIKYRKMLINTFVNKIYLYDDGRAMIIFNVENSTYNGTITPSDNILSSFKSEIAPLNNKYMHTVVSVCFLFKSCNY